MSHPIIATPALSDQCAALTGGPVAGSAPLSNLLKQQPSRDPTIFVDLTQVYWIWDLGAAYTVNLLAAIYTTTTAAATIRLRGADSIPHLTSAPGYDSTAALAWPRADLAALGYSRFPAYLYSAAGFGSYRYWRVDIVDAANPLGYVQVGRAFLASTAAGTLYTFPRGTAPDGTSGPREVATRIETAAGAVFPTVNAKRDHEKFSVPFVTEADAKGVLEAIQRTRGVSRAVLFSRDPGNALYLAQKTVYGLLTIDDKPYVGWVGPTSVNGVTSAAGAITYNISGIIEEMP